MSATIQSTIVFPSVFLKLKITIYRTAIVLLCEGANLLSVAWDRTQTEDFGEKDTGKNRGVTEDCSEL
jgi:hypothetical protein